MAHGFFVLPPELRLQVYGHHIKASMANGTITDIGGLLFSYHEIHREMTPDHISKVRPILDSMSG